MKRPTGFDPPSPPDSRGSKRAAHKPVQEVQRAPAKTKAAKELTSPLRNQTVPTRGPDRNPVSKEARRKLQSASRERRRYEKSEIRRFTKRSRHRRLGWLGGVGLALALAGLLAVAVYSPLLALRTIEIDGTSAVSATDVHDAIDGQIGTPLALLDYGMLRGELDKFPLIRSFVTEVVPPSTLIVHIVERAPIASIATPTGYAVVDPAGVVLSSSSNRMAGLPFVDLGTGATDSVAFRAIAEVLLALPESIRSVVDTASATSKDDVTFVLAGNGQRVVWGSAERSALKARVLQDLMATQGASEQHEFDVSAPLSPVVRSR